MSDFRSLLARQDGAIHRRQLRALGIDHRRLRALVWRGELAQVRDHVFVAKGAPATWRRRVWVELLDATPTAVVGFRTAASLFHVGRFARAGIDILETEDRSHRRGAGSTAIHRTTWLPAHHRVVLDGLPATSLPRTLFDLASLVSPARRRRGLVAVEEAAVVRAIDDALAGPLRVDQLHRVVGELGRRGRPGTALMRRVVDERSEGYVATESELEDLVLAVLASAGVPLPVRQRNLGGTTPVGRVDFAYLGARVVVEADSRKHHTSLTDAEADRWRDLELAAAGFVVVRVTWRQLVTDPERFVAGLRKLLARRDPELLTTLT